MKSEPCAVPLSLLIHQTLVQQHAAVTYPWAEHAGRRLNLHVHEEDSTASLEKLAH